MKDFRDFGIQLPTGAKGEIDTTCPECSPHRKKKRDTCLSVNVEEGVWVCHHCGWAGTLSEGEQRRGDDHYRMPTIRPRRKPKTDLPDKAVKWFADRGISEDTLKRFGVGCGEVYMPQVEGKVNAIQFPYYRDGELINIKHRDGQKNFRMEAGAERILFNLDSLDSDTAVIVEGEIDALSVAEVYDCPVVSVPDGAPAPDTDNYTSKFAFLEADRERIQNVKNWILATDSDRPGQALEQELARRFGREKCSRAEFPSDVKDPNECLVKHGAPALFNALHFAKPLPIEGVIRAEDLAAEVDRIYEHGREKGHSTGWPNIDECYTVRPGEMTVITGIPNSGKSNWIDALVTNLAKRHGWRFGIFSPENQPLEEHVSRMIEKWINKPLELDFNDRMSPEDKDHGRAKVHEHFAWIMPEDDADWTMEVVLDRARALVFRDGIRGLVIDPWNEMEQYRSKDQTETEYIASVLKQARQFARRHEVHVWIVAHPSKLSKRQDGSYPTPSPYDISGSAHWRNKADNCITIWRDLSDDDERTIDVHVQKVRFRKQVGKLGTRSLRYNGATGNYSPEVREAA